MKDNNRLYTNIAIIALCVGSIMYLVSNHTFGHRCAKAGYQKAEHEACVYRLNQGGFLYKENIGLKNE